MEDQKLSLSKSQLRGVLLDYRRLMPDAEFLLRNERLCENLLTYLESKQGQIIHLFLPIARNNEPDLRLIFSALKRRNHKIVVSKTDFKNRVLHHYFLEDDTVLEINQYGIPEPVNAKAADFSKVQIVLVPLSTADKLGNRIGYGGGFYDKLLEGSSAVKIGLSLAPLMDEIQQKDSWDEKLDRVLTPFENGF